MVWMRKWGNQREISKKQLTFLLSALFVAGTLFSLVYMTTLEPKWDVPVIQSFPLDPNIEYDAAYSRMTLVERDSTPMLTIEAFSKTKEPQYLRQDVVLVYQNNRLIYSNYPWQQDTDTILIKDSFPVQLQEMNRFQMITFHYSERHHNQKITSQYTITTEELYVKKTEDQLISFKKAVDLAEKAYVKRVDQNVKLGALDELGIARQNFNRAYDLIQLSLYSKRLLNKQEDDARLIVARLWEGVYRYYILGQGLGGRSPGSLKGISMPYIMTSPNQTQLIVHYIRADGKRETLLQDIIQQGKE